MTKGFGLRRHFRHSPFSIRHFAPRYCVKFDSALCGAMVSAFR